MSDEGRDETPEERADRHWTDLLQELRVTETGVQVLFSLLLTVPFSARFGDVTPFQRRVYFAALLLTAAANVALIAPVAYHRTLFRQGEKARVVEHSNRLAVAGLVLLVLAVSAVLAAHLRRAVQHAGGDRARSRLRGLHAPAVVRAAAAPTGRLDPHVHVRPAPQQVRLEPQGPHVQQVQRRAPGGGRAQHAADEQA